MFEIILATLIAIPPAKADLVTISPVGFKKLYGQDGFVLFYYLKKNDFKDGMPDCFNIQVQNSEADFGKAVSLDRDLREISVFGWPEAKRWLIADNLDNREIELSFYFIKTFQEDKWKSITISVEGTHLPDRVKNEAQCADKIMQIKGVVDFHR
jgi:hypothetical protein